MILHRLDFFQLKMDATFLQIVKAVFKNWTALQLVIQHGPNAMDGREKEQFMAEGVVEYFQKNDNLYCDEVEDLIDYMLEYEFNSRPEDGSTSEIAKLFCECADLISKGKENEAIAKLPHSISLPETNSAIESSICSNPETAPPLEEMNNLTVDESENSQQNSRNTPDEDGWTFVRKKK